MKVGDYVRFVGADRSIGLVEKLTDSKIYIRWLGTDWTGNKYSATVSEYEIQDDISDIIPVPPVLLALYDIY